MALQVAIMVPAWHPEQPGPQGARRRRDQVGRATRRGSTAGRPRTTSLTAVTDLRVNPHEAPGGQFSDVVAIGDITVTADSVLVPQGRFPLVGVTWTIQDSTTTVRTTPAYARRLATVLGVTVVGLGFLLIKERHESGFIAVTVVGEGLYHTVQFPPGAQSRAHVASLVNRARALAAAITVSEG